MSPQGLRTFSLLIPLFAVQPLALAADAAYLEAKFGRAIEIDGRLKERVWRTADSLDVKVKLPNGRLARARLKVANDNKNVYIAFSFPVPENLSGQSFFVRFDDENTETLDEGQDVIGMNPALGEFHLLDQVRTNRPPCPSPNGKPRSGYCSMEDVKFNGTTDGAGAYRVIKREAVYEFSHPLRGDDRENDIQLSPGDTLGIRLSLRLVENGADYPNGFGDTSFPKGGFQRVRLARQ